MKILFQYLKPYKWLVVLTIVLAAINTGFFADGPNHLWKNDQPRELSSNGRTSAG
jgi:hypothetical protein